ncbi:A-kinase-interacting protein 1 isoform X2 [Amia ocellicauda]|uniref:A-kinase-interacting protein 1 isoform X2 n=1 Tax=Amia ocellicauda TaxID=2972642 RepID=UPI00346393A6|nr:AKIP1 protein [Amia calva]
MERRQTWLESSLVRSSRLGLEVLQRAQRRNVEWPTADQRLREENPRRKERYVEESGEEEQKQTCLDDAFDTILEFMAHTTHQCKNFYKSVPLYQSGHSEVNHVCRYHTQGFPHVPSTQRLYKNQEPRSTEDFHIEVAPGTYAITAGAQDADNQTRLVRVKAGESVNLSFAL